MYRRLGRTAEALASYEKALALQEPERQFLQERIRQVEIIKDLNVFVEQGLQIACAAEHPHDLDSAFARQVENNIAAKGKASQVS